MVLERLASALGRNDEEPNIALALALVAEVDEVAIGQLVEALKGKDQAIGFDAIKVLYEIGAQKPLLIAPHVQVLVQTLTSRHNRLVWGAMTALATIAPLVVTELLSQLDTIVKAYKEGSVITVDNSISVLAAMAATDEKILPLLYEHLRGCRPKEVVQHAKRCESCFNTSNASIFMGILEARVVDLSPAQHRKLKDILKKLCTFQ